MCVVLGVGVISVFDAVAFLACTHRVSSAGLGQVGMKETECGVVDDHVVADKEDRVLSGLMLQSECSMFERSTLRLLFFIRSL